MGGLGHWRQWLNAAYGITPTYLDSANCILNKLTISLDVTGSNPREAHITVALESKSREVSLTRGARFWNNLLKVGPSMFILVEWSSCVVL